MTRARKLLSRAAVLTTLAVAGCGGSAVAPSVTPAPVYAGPSAAVVGGWPHKWCDVVDASLDRQQVVQIMGAPTASHASQDSWDAFGYDFTAFYDEAGNVSQLDTSDIDLSEEQRAKLTPACMEVRQ